MLQVCMLSSGMSFVVILRKQLVKMPLISASMDFLRAAACQMIRVAFVGTRDRLQLWSLFDVARGVHVASVYAEFRDVVVVILRKQLVKMPLISASMDFLRAAACQMIRVVFVGTRDRLRLWSLFDVARGVHVASVYAELRDVVVVILRKQLVKMPLISASMGFSEGCRMPNDSCRVRGDSGPVAVVELVRCRPRRACCKCVC